jgi:carboxyl-terminal processing protease
VKDLSTSLLFAISVSVGIVPRVMQKFNSGILLGALFVLTACGGGGSSDGGSNNISSRPNPFTGGGGWTAGVYKDASQFADRCANPRTGTDPFTGAAYPDGKGSYRDENNFLRSWSNDTYLWYREIVDVNPANYSDTIEYFSLLRTTAVTPSGTPKDQFHFTYSSDEWERLSEAGITYGYGMELSWISTALPRELIVAYTQPNSPADLASIKRGAKILKIDGVDLINAYTSADITILNDGLFPSVTGQAHIFTLDEAGVVRDVILQSASVASVPVQNVKTIDTATGKVGYLTFNDHIAPAEQGLIDAINQLDAVGVNDLVLDLRYNGGGYLAIASQLAYMIAGYSPTAGKTFEELQFNDKYPNKDPVTGEVLASEPFYSTSLGFSVSEGQALPTLDLNRVYVLTSSDTCSASEALMNGLRGVGIQVIQIGRTTCGKPYGFYPQPNCGTTYFTVQFRGVNAKNFGDYSDGFAPASSDDGKARILGCSVADDFTHALGDPDETRLAAALYHRTNNRCPAGSSSVGVMQKAASPLKSIDGHLIKTQALQNKLMRPLR